MYFIINRQIHSHYTRQTQNLYTPQAKTNLGKKSIKYSGAKEWNSVPIEIWKIRCIKKLKKKVKTSSSKSIDASNIYCSVLPKVFRVPVLRTSGSWSLLVRMEGLPVQIFSNYFGCPPPSPFCAIEWQTRVFNGCSCLFYPCDHFQLLVMHSRPVYE